MLGAALNHSERVIPPRGEVNPLVLSVTSRGGQTACRNTLERLPGNREATLMFIVRWRY